MEQFESAKDLIEYSKETLEEIKLEYEKSLQQKNIEKKLLIKIKNFTENLRSALDYTAYELFYKYCKDYPLKRKDTWIYFPYAGTGSNQMEFQGTSDRKIPGIRITILYFISIFQIAEVPKNFDILAF